MKLGIIVRGARQAAQAMQRAAEKTEATLKRGLQKAASIIAGEAKRQVYAGRPDHLIGQTGRLRQSIQTAVDPHGLRARVGTNVIYARIHELGGTIRPKTQQYLRFPIGDSWVTVREVTIPPRPYLAPAAKAKGQEAADALANTLYEVFGP